MEKVDIFKYTVWGTSSYLKSKSYHFYFIFDPKMVNFEQNMVFYAILIQLKNEFNLKIRFNSTS